jgi:glycosyltransferase involved in cell wall biosynthesis
LVPFFYRLRKQKYHLIIWDLYPDVLVNFGVLKDSSWSIKYWKKINRNCLQNAENVFTLGQHLMDAIAKYMNKPVVIIPNWVNSEFVKPMEKKDNTFAIKHGLTEKLVVMYSGNLGLTHDIESVVEAADFLKDNQNVHFVIIGEGAKKTKIEQLVKDKGLGNVLMLPYQDKEVLPYSLSCADIGVVTLSQGAEMISVPSKTYYTLAAGSVILALASKESELGVLINTHNCGVVFETPKASEVAQFIEDLITENEKLKLFKENARKASFEYTPENAKRYYDYIYGKTVK